MKTLGIFAFSMTGESFLISSSDRLKGDGGEVLERNSSKLVRMCIADRSRRDLGRVSPLKAVNTSMVPSASRRVGAVMNLPEPGDEESPRDNSGNVMPRSCILKRACLESERRWGLTCDAFMTPRSFPGLLLSLLACRSELEIWCADTLILIF